MEFLGEWGIRGDGPGKLQTPCGIATDVYGSVYIADSQSAYIQKFSRTGEPLQAFQEPLLKNPCYLALDSGGAIYISDLGRNLLVITFPDGRRYRAISGRIKSKPDSPATLAVDGAGNILVADFDGDSVRKFNPRGKLTLTWGKYGDAPGQFKRSGPIAVSRNGEIFVGDFGNKRIQVFSLNGEWLRSWPLSGDAPLEGLAASTEHVFGSRGGKLETWTTDGRQVHVEDLGSRFPRMVGISLAYSEQKELFALLHGQARILRYRVNLP
jgi:DNA-binding beta-propeller fold protein YncE